MASLFAKPSLCFAAISESVGGAGHVIKMIQCKEWKSFLGQIEIIPCPRGPPTSHPTAICPRLSWKTYVSKYEVNYSNPIKSLSIHCTVKCSRQAIKVLGSWPLSRSPGQLCPLTPGAPGDLACPRPAPEPEWRRLMEGKVAGDCAENCSMTSHHHEYTPSSQVDTPKQS